MYSILPSIVAILFLAYSVYVLHAKGLTRVTTAFAILCITTFFWQATWAVLFQVEDPELAAVLTKVGWLLILFLPTSLYQFLVEVTGRQGEWKMVYGSYGFAALLAAFLVTTNLVVDGYYDYFWGYYPRAGLLHPLHVLQTVVVVLRGLYLTYQKQAVVKGGEKIKLRYCAASLLIYFFGAADYLCNYGVVFYPPGVVFIAISLGLMAVATSRYHVMDDSRMLAASVAHEMRTPLATIRLQSQALGNYLPVLVQGYQQAANHNLVKEPIPQEAFNQLADLSNRIQSQVSLATQAIDTLLALVSAQNLSEKDFRPCSAQAAVELAAQQVGDQKPNARIELDVRSDFMVSASPDFLVFVLINLMKNSLEALNARDDGHIVVVVNNDSRGRRIEVIDNGPGIDGKVLPHIFDHFFTTKTRGTNTGVGLAFCRNVMQAFGGTIKCNSVVGQFTQFTLAF
ncbi:GHKL domain-containing protein [Proteobacteria bacterium 005FR1]|nr:GHKL domain-containing protein [Proteobacteria bacterium 005FR1]